MKYRDLILLFVGIIFFLTLAYTLGVDQSLWYVPVLVFIALIVVVYKLWIEK